MAACSCAHVWTVWRCVCAQERQFQRHPFRAVMGSRQLVEYVVLDAEPAGPSTSRFALADVQVAFTPSCLNICNASFGGQCAGSSVQTRMCNGGCGALPAEARSELAC